MSQAYYVVLYYLSWLWFGLGGLVLNLGCAVLLLCPGRRRLGRGVRGAIRWLFSFWLKWIHASGVVRITWTGFDGAELTPGTVYVANHPTLVDAPILLSRIPNAIYIFKPALLRNPVIAPAAILAGYPAGDAGVDLIRDAAEKVARGQSLLVFPEGTRTAPGHSLEPLKPGFALIAQRAQAPIQVMTLRANRRIVARGVPWWKPPQLPAAIEITLGSRIPADTGLSVTELAKLTQERLASGATVVPTS